MYRMYLFFLRYCLLYFLHCVYISVGIPIFSSSSLSQSGGPVLVRGFMPDQFITNIGTFVRNSEAGCHLLATCSLVAGFKRVFIAPGSEHRSAGIPSQLHCVEGQKPGYSPS